MLWDGELCLVCNTPVNHPLPCFCYVHLSCQKEHHCTRKKGPVLCTNCQQPATRWYGVRGNEPACDNCQRKHNQP